MNQSESVKLKENKEHKARAKGSLSASSLSILLALFASDCLDVNLLKHISTNT